MMVRLATLSMRVKLLSNKSNLSIEARAAGPDAEYLASVLVCVDWLLGDEPSRGILEAFSIRGADS
jgi:hypothetical protein